jgi:DHA3 family macrolide efflux protein-like MFS transporter
MPSGAIPPGEVSASGRPIPPNWLAIISFIWGGQAFSILTSYAAGYAALWYITETTNSAMMLAVATLVSILPTGLLSPFGGVLADKFNRRSIMLVSDASVGLLSAILGLIIWLGQANLFIIMVVIFVRAVAQAFHGPAMTAAMPLLVPERHLVRINSLDQLMWSVAGIGAPALGIFLYSTVGFHSVMFLDAVGAVLACVGLALVKIPTIRDESMEGRHVFANLADGYRAVSSIPGLHRLMWLCTAAMLIFMPIGSLFPLMTYQHFQGDGYMASLIEAVFGIGLLAGSLIVMAWGGGKRLVILVVMSGFAVGLTTLLSGALPSSMFWAFVVLSALMGFGAAFYNGPLMTIFQRHTDEEKLGRVMGLFGAIVSLTSPVGLVIAGFTAEFTGIAAWFLVSGALMTAASGIPFLMKSVMGLDNESATEVDGS